MKRAATIFFLAVIVCVQTPIGQFLKLPYLIQHYIKHQKQDGATLLNFLEAHYITNHRDADVAEDEHLPFKNFTFHSIANAIVSPTVQVYLLLPLPIEIKIICPETPTRHQSLASIFHPPRM